MKPTQDRLKELLEYDPELGVWTWKAVIGRGRARMAGRLAGNKSTRGYWTVRVDTVRYQAHRLAWFYMTGAWPVDQIDHINGDRTDNRWANLREATNAQNGANAGPRKNNKSGYRGVSWNKNWKRWVAQIGPARERLGVFDSPEEAYAVYLKAAKERFGEYASVGERS